jgi:predicted secreted Zn-dependent protease
VFICVHPWLNDRFLLQRVWLVVLFALLLPVLAEAQNPVRWTTNYYAVTGATLPEIRQSMRQSRPWKEKFDLEAMTEWKVTWQFSVMATASGCRCSSFGTQTSITVTMPRWFTPTNAPDTVKQIWQKYAKALAQHEAGHAAIALAAGTELRKRLPELGEGMDCATLKQRINDLGQQVIAEHRKRDKDYDASTRHGATQGASLPGRTRRDRGEQ